MNLETITLYDRMNGDKILPDAMRIFNEKVQKDPLLHPLFEKLDPEVETEHQKIVLTYAMGGAHKWPGKTFRQMHAKVDLEDKHFDAYLNHLVHTFEELDISEHLVEEARKIIELTRREILNRYRMVNM